MQDKTLQKCINYLHLICRMVKYAGFCTEEKVYVYLCVCASMHMLLYSLCSCDECIREENEKES